MIILSLKRARLLTPPRTAGRDTRAAMIDYARPAYDQNMYELHLSPTPPPAPARLDDFQVFKKTAYVYGNYYGSPYYDPNTEPELDASNNVYHNLLTSRDYYRDSWRNKMVCNWTDEDTVSWIIETTQCMGYSEYEVPYYHFKIPGAQLHDMRRDDLVRLLSHVNVDPNLTRRIADNLYEKLQNLLQGYSRQPTVLRFAESDSYAPDQISTVLDLDSLDHKNRLYNTDYKPNDSSLLLGACDSSDDAEYDLHRTSVAGSPVYYGSDGSKSGDEEDKRKKRPPGRPKGSGRKVCKRPRSVSVPEFLRDLLLNPEHCPSKIRWEDHSLGKFKFVKPDEVAKLWGCLKNNENMNFEKFSRAMRYHYRQNVLVSVPTARLVYQFGHKGPAYKTDNPNFQKIKTELDSYDMYS